MLKPTFVHSLIAASLVISIPAHADLTMKMTMTTSATVARDERLTPHELASAKSLVEDETSTDTPVSITYCSATKIKMVSDGEVVFTDLQRNTMTFMDPSSKTMYIVSSPASGKNHALEANVVATTATKTLLGHETHLYKEYIRTPKGTTVGHFWMAPDIPAPPALGANDPMVKAAMAKLPGTPLMGTFTTIGEIDHVNVTMKYDFVVTSTAPIPPAAFKMPSGYATTPAPGSPGYTAYMLNALNPKQKRVPRHWVPGHYE